MSANSSFDLSKLEVGDFRPKRARFAAFKDLALKPVKLKKTKVHSVYTPRVTEPLTSGRGYVYFFPLGQTEPAIVTMSDREGKTRFSLVVHPITGRVRIYNQEVQPPGGAAYDDEGDGWCNEAVGRPGSRCWRSWSRSRSCATTLVVLLEIVTNNVRATNHAKLTTAATFLARTKMSDIEDDILYDGFSSETENAKGTFKDDGYPQFRWETSIERIELPTDMTQKTQDAANERQPRTARTRWR